MSLLYDQGDLTVTAYKLAKFLPSSWILEVLALVLYLHVCSPAAIPLLCLSLSQQRGLWQ